MSDSAPSFADVAPQEIELKLALTPEAADTLPCHPLLAAHAPAVQTLANTYYDTPEGTLAAARIALRLRRMDGVILQTLKTAGHGGGGLSTRSEWEWRVADDALDLAGLAALAPVQALGDAALSRLAPQLRTDFTRRRYEIRYRRSVIEVALDNGDIIAGKRRAPIRELELELKAGSPDALWALADTLAESAALRPSDSSKAARGNALGKARWPLPEAHTPAEHFHRALLALDAWHDSGRTTFLNAARHALAALAAASERLPQQQQPALTLCNGLGKDGQPDVAFGRAALILARGFARGAPLS
ncbi:hypothetical protein GCM10022228_08510 [Halomonas cibimaris]|uniref:CYTH domain-containing protein n=1 Tax=Halomonas cibimaris TaxID=657012 RepID=A0ABP7LJ29_9GAMM